MPPLIHAPLWRMILDATIFGVTGIALLIVGYYIWELVTPYNLRRELQENKNLAVAVPSAAFRRSPWARTLPGSRTCSVCRRCRRRPCSGSTRKHWVCALPRAPSSARPPSPTTLPRRPRRPIISSNYFACFPFPVAPDHIHIGA